MKLLTLRSDDRFHPAVLIGDEVLDLVAARRAVPLAHCLPQTMRGLLAAEDAALDIVSRVADAAMGSANARLRAAGAITAYAQAALGPVVPDPALVLSGSMNSHGHLREMGDQPPEHPCAFLKVPSALSGSGWPIPRPPGYGDMVDWEGELCVVIGAPCHRVGVQDAMSYVVGYTLMNDISAREFVMPFVISKGPSPSAQAWERNVLGKNYPGFAPIGPVIATKDELPDPLDYHLETIVNGEVMQSSTREDLVFGPAEMVSYFSQFYVLAPGDIISMGSPPGVGMARKPPQFLRPGDTVEVREPGIGSLLNVLAP